MRIDLLVLITIVCACNSDYLPKPRDYPRVILPERKYQNWSAAECPFSFEFPVYSRIVRDTLFFNEKPENPCWLNLVYPDFNATVYISYKVLRDEKDLEQMREDAYRLTYKHTRRADYIDPMEIVNKDNSRGLFYKVGGDAASATQFYLTDTTHHFIRGALYFNEAPNFDSLAPVIKFIDEDILHMLGTFQWR